MQGEGPSPTPGRLLSPNSRPQGEEEGPHQLLSDWGWYQDSEGPRCGAVEHRLPGARCQPAGVLRGKLCWRQGHGHSLTASQPRGLGGRNGALTAGWGKVRVQCVEKPLCVCVHMREIT